MNYRTVEDLERETHRLAENITEDIDLVVGIPRSGVLVANLLCLYLDVPMTDVEGLCNDRILDTGARYEDGEAFDELDSVLVVTDSVLSGREMTKTRDRLAKHDFPFEITFATIFVSPRGQQYVDHWCEVIPSPRVFEWNIMDQPERENPPTIGRSQRHTAETVSNIKAEPVLFSLRFVHQMCSRYYHRILRSMKSKRS